MEQRPMCEYHMELQSMITEINVSVKNIEKEIGKNWFDFKEHINESIPVRLKVESHEIKLQGFDTIVKLLIANVFVIISAAIGITSYLSSMNKQVLINTDRLTVIEGRINK